MAGWVAPPATGIHAKPADFEYVRPLMRDVGWKRSTPRLGSSTGTCRRAGERIAFYCENRSLTYRALQEATLAAADGLKRSA